MGKKLPDGQMDFFPLILDESKKATMKNEMIRGRWHLNKIPMYIVRIMISKVKMGDKSFDNFVVTTGSLAKDLNLDKSYVSRNIEKWINEIYDESLVVETECGYAKFHWASAAAYNKDKRIGVLRLNAELAPYLTDLHGVFGGYDIGSMLKFDSVYTTRIYDLFNAKCEGYEFTKETKFYLSLEDIRFSCGLDDFNGDELKKGAGKLGHPGNMKQRIIDPAIAKIEEVKDLKITCTPRKKKGSKEIIGFDFNVIPLKVSDQSYIEQSKDLESGQEEVASASRSSKKKNSSGKKNSFNNFQQNDYDFDALEKALIANK